MQPTPQLLPPVDRIEIVDLREVGYRVDRASDYMSAARSAPFTAVVGNEAEAIASLWRNLPPGEVKRCHVPPFGFRFYVRDELVAEASVCWRCNNVYGFIHGQALSYGFDGSDPVAQRLLDESRRRTGIQADG